MANNLGASMASNASLLPSRFVNERITYPGRDLGPAHTALTRYQNCVWLVQPGWVALPGWMVGERPLLHPSASEKKEEGEGGRRQETCHHRLPLPLGLTNTQGVSCVIMPMALEHSSSSPLLPSSLRPHHHPHPHPSSFIHSWLSPTHNPRTHNPSLSPPSHTG